MNLDCKLFGARNYVPYKRCSLYCKHKCRLLNSMECDSCTQLGWMNSSMYFWNTCKMFFFGICDWRSVSLLVWFVFPLFLLLMCLFLHSTCFGVAFFSIHCLSLDCREDFQNAKVKSWKATFFEQYFKSTQCKVVFSIFFCTSHAPHFTCNCIVHELEDLLLLKMSYVG